MTDKALRVVWGVWIGLVVLVLAWALWAQLDAPVEARALCFSAESPSAIPAHSSLSLSVELHDALTSGEVIAFPTEGFSVMCNDLSIYDAVSAPDVTRWAFIPVHTDVPAGTALRFVLSNPTDHAQSARTWCANLLAGSADGVHRLAALRFGWLLALGL